MRTASAPSTAAPREVCTRLPACSPYLCPTTSAAPCCTPVRTCRAAVSTAPNTSPTAPSDAAATWRKSSEPLELIWLPKEVPLAMPATIPPTPTAAAPRVVATPPTTSFPTTAALRAPSAARMAESGTLTACSTGRRCALAASPPILSSSPVMSAVARIPPASRAPPATMPPATTPAVPPGAAPAALAHATPGPRRSDACRSMAPSTAARVSSGTPGPRERPKNPSGRTITKSLASFLITGVALGTTRVVSPKMTWSCCPPAPSPTAHKTMVPVASGVLLSPWILTISAPMIFTRTSMVGSDADMSSLWPLAFPYSGVCTLRVQHVKVLPNPMSLHRHLPPLDFLHRPNNGANHEAGHAGWPRYPRGGGSALRGIRGSLQDDRMEVLGLEPCDLEARGIGGGKIGARG
mmetsp:Transcript_12594/g.39733  ORF Transcript_12594/g.39733 Transcript_12594/m.39733 type:complete len:408 (+) Transcript_12594:133-1356(+)